MCQTSRMTIGDVGRRERKKSATHRQLRSAALRLVAKRGLQKVTVEDIAEAADVSTRTFYDHFASKEDAIVGFDAVRVNQFRTSLRARPPDEQPLRALRAVMRALLDESSEEWPLRMEIIRFDPELLARMFASFASVEQAMIEVIGERTGADPDRDLYPVLVTAVATGAFRASVSSWHRTGEAVPLSKIFDAAFDQVAAGLTVPSTTKKPVTSRSVATTPTKAGRK